MTQQTEEKTKLLALIEKLPTNERDFYLSEIRKLSRFIAGMKDMNMIQDVLDNVPLQIAMQQWLASEYRMQLTALSE